MVDRRVLYPIVDAWARSRAVGTTTGTFLILRIAEVYCS